ncbi:hypothetical protein [Pseudanabaena sp. UWO310]|uniref:hypothetical protein n=1 Tax=Pseudanabaena sp. UWO310 TaxID=2480795 RepID=UPI00115BAB1E|nr:hypothetical protein [Pseudanabaena sp. UWO310]TYQ29997.1 hypothetical protein PseudUWO310_11305 [Pseudanabaena sp. UWO310]
MSDDDLDIQAKISWLTVRTTDIKAVVEVLDLKGERQGRWQDASQKIDGKWQTTANTFLYVSQDSWVVVPYDWEFVSPADTEITSGIEELCALAKENLIIKLSQQFGEAQLFEFDTEYFCGATSWMLARDGQLIRSFMYGLSSNFLRNVGEPTDAEQFMDWARVRELENWTEEDWKRWEDEEEIDSFIGCRGDSPKAVETIKVARQWSVDPLCTDHPEKSIGVLGNGKFVLCQ